MGVKGMMLRPARYKITPEERRLVGQMLACRIRAPGSPPAQCCGRFYAGCQCARCREAEVLHPATWPRLIPG
jgi:hypothetical protein